MGGKKLLTSHLRAHLPYYMTAVLCLAAANVINSFFPHVLGLFTDSLQAKRLDSAGIIRYSLWLLAIAIGYGGLFASGQFLNHRMGRKFEYTARQRLFRHFTDLSEAFYSKNGIGKLLSFVMNDVQRVRDSIAGGLNQMTNATIMLISVTVVMTLSHFPLGLVGVCVLPMISIPFMVVYLGPRIRERSKLVQESLASMTESAEEQFGGIRITKTFAAEETANRRYGETVDMIYKNQLQLVRLASVFQAFLPLAGALSIAIAILYGGYMTIHHDITLGNFVALTLYLQMIINPLRQAGSVINTMQRSRASLDRLNQLLSTDVDIKEAEDAEPLEHKLSSLEIRSLDFRYPEAGEASLQDIDLQLKAGHTLGIVGKTGSGKTTLVKLLLRTYDPPRGSIIINGQDILDLTLESLRTQIGYVPQDGFLFSSTIHDNIAFSDRSLDLPPVENAAKLAEIYDNIQEFPEGFDTKLGERGVTLSGGQRQRTSLARGLIKDAPLLILDDSVSAVDAMTETGILANLRKTRKGKTTIIIAHRISAVKHADEIVVLDEGRIIERGTHEELLAANGYYASLYTIQEEGIIGG